MLFETFSAFGGHALAEKKAVTGQDQNLSRPATPMGWTPPFTDTKNRPFSPFVSGLQRRRFPKVSASFPRCPGRHACVSLLISTAVKMGGFVSPRCAPWSGNGKRRKTAAAMAERGLPQTSKPVCPLTRAVQKMSPSVSVRQALRRTNVLVVGRFGGGVDGR